MLNNKVMAATILVAVLLIAGVVFAAEEVTLATVPTIVPMPIDGDVHTFKIQTTNSPNTEMTVEKSLNGTFTDKVILYEWQPFSNNQTFSDTLAENTRVYYRIKARNLNNIETAYSEPIIVYSTPSRPQLSNIDRQAQNITLTFEGPADGVVFWVERVGLEPQQTTKKFIDNVSPATNYEYTFWADNHGVISPVNTLTVWSLPLLNSTDITIIPGITTAEIIVKQQVGTVQVEIKEGANWVLLTEPYTLDNLAANTEYEFRIRCKSDNDEYTEWISIKTKTKQAAMVGGGGSLDAQKLIRQQEFNKQAESLFYAISYMADGDINSSSAWIEFSIPKSQLDMKITIDNETMQKQDKVKFTNLKDNSDYTAKVIISNNEVEYAKDISISTPNRTPPEILGLYYDTDTGELIVKVKANTEIK
jgi:hypothetical protein